MSASHGCKIGRVKFKSGGEMRLLDCPTVGEPDVIEMLVDLLRDARKGAVVSFGFVVVCEDGSVETGWAYGDAETYHHMHSGAVILVSRLTEAGDEL